MTLSPAVWNHDACGTKWVLSDLPPQWAGRQLLESCDYNKDGQIDPEEKTLIPWADFSDIVAQYQESRGLHIDGLLGTKQTLPDLRKAFPNKPEASGDVLWTIGGVDFCKAERLTVPPANPVAEGPTAIRNCWNNYGGAIAELAGKYGIDVEVALAVFATEAGGRSHGDLTGLAIIRIERVITPEGKWVPRWNKNPQTRGALEAMFRKNFGRGQVAEWKCLMAYADAMGAEHACDKTSWGLGQIMGFNAELVGNVSAVDLALNAQRDPYQQIEDFFQFCDSASLIDDIQRGDFIGFAKGYNGPGQPKYYESVINQNLATVRAMGIEV